MNGSSIECAAALDRTLIDLLNLSLVTNQARWNLTGPGFGALRQVLDELAACTAGAADAVAGHAVTVGHHPDARAAVIARANVLSAIDPGPVGDADAITLFNAALGTVIGRLHTSVNAVADDPVTGNLLIGIARYLERTAWIIRAQGPAAVAAHRVVI
jgi:starvation-inducible DNA-binding protein